MKLDLQDAYFSVPIHNSNNKYLRFVFQGITYEYQCLPFGLSSAPRTFTELLKPIIVLLRIQGIRIVIYLDDMLILDQSPERQWSIFRTVVNLLQRLGFLIKQEKCSQAPSQCLEFPVFRDQLEGDDKSCTQRQTPKAPNRVQECNPESLADAERTLGFIRQNEPLHPSGSSPGTFALSCSAEATYQQHSPEQTSLEQDKGLSDRRINNRPPMVDFDADTSFQQVYNITTGVRPGYLHRRVQSRMGITVRRNHDIGTMEHPRIQTTHQYSRNESSPSGHPFLSDDTGKNATTYWSADGNLYSSCICQQERGNQVFDFSSLGSGNLERLSTERNMDNSTTPSGSTERRCGLGFSSLQRTHRVDSGQGDLHTYSHKVLHSTSRLVCISAQSSTTPLCFSAPRPGCNGGRCNDIALEQMDIVHSCANYNASSHSEEDTRISGNQLSTHCPELAGPDMVSATIGDVGQHPVPSSNDGNESGSTYTVPFDREAQHPLWRTMKLAVWPLSGNAVEQEDFHRKFVTSLWPPGEKERKRDMKVLGDFGLTGVSHGINVHFQPL